MSLRARIAWGRVVNCLWWAVTIPWLASLLMQRAEAITGERFSWPQINFMSAYPTDVRNGYLLFVAAVATVVLVNSGLSVLVFKASPGKALFGVAYRSSDRTTPVGKVILRLAYILLVLGFLLLAGLILGFVFGSSADIASLIALFCGFGLMFYAFFTTGNHITHRVNRAVGLYPVLRT